MINPTEGCGKMCQCLPHCLQEAVCALTWIPPIEIAADEREKVYSATHRINPQSVKALCARREERQVTICKWKEQFSESSKGEWTHLLLHNLEAWSERGHGRMNFYLTQVMSSHGAFNAYLFRIKLVESPDCTN